MTFGHFGKKQK